MLNLDFTYCINNLILSHFQLYEFLLKIDGCNLLLYILIKWKRQSYNMPESLSSTITDSSDQCRIKLFQEMCGTAW